MVWATAADVTTYTGTALSAFPDPDACLALANATITIYCNRTEAASASMSARDLLALKMATSFQAAWLTQQDDYLTRVNFESSTIDGESVRFSGEQQQNLAPMARRALRNLSWKGARTLSIPDISVPLGGGSIIDFLDESSDSSDSWSPY
ncbi:MAG TPA: hypothetical protein VJW23_16525 [Propionibacteriaceae bacterium]|nr:hypothetical protein [Propionibacteriaceae bacterium]